MNHSGADGVTGPREGENKKRSYEGKSTSAPAVNGTSMAVRSTVRTTEDQMAHLPPEIIHIAAEFYHPLDKLLTRVAQECFNELQDVVNNLAQMPANSYPNGVASNGHVGANGSQSNSEASKEKRLLLAKFAQEQRAKFIKLLVLTEWSRKSAVGVSKMIDIMSWAQEQARCMNNVDGQLFNIKIHSSGARMPNPDIRTALEVLSTGKAAWIPDMGFVQPEPLSAEKALKVLRYLNTTISIRLNVHESLPRHLRKWHVASGRATFTVDNEFELELFCYSEDTSEPWLFADLRLLFSPAPSITTGSHFFHHFREQCNHTLKTSGLTGCFDFLHNFVLTHKIALLKKQAHELLRIGWAGSLKIEPVHRALVIQYWTDKPGKKNWIEIGLASGKSKNGKISWRGPPISFLTVRWFRAGVEVTDADLRFDWKNLSMERILKKVLALHTGHILQSGRNSLPTQMITKATLSETEPCDCTLEVSLGRPDNKTTVSLEPVTGRYILQPITLMSARTESFINQDRDKELGSAVTQLLAQTLQDAIQRHAQQLGWRPVAKHALRLETVKEAVKFNVLQFSMYWPAGWKTNWALAAVIDSSGESWWIVELGARSATIVYVERLMMETQQVRPPVNRSTLSSVERVALQLLSFRATIRELQAQQKPHSLRSELATCRQSAAVQSFLRGWVLHLRTADLVTSKPGDDPWLQPGIRLMCQGFKSDYKNISHIASGTMVKSVAADMQKLMSASPQKHFTFSENGNFSILLSTPFGQSVFEELKRCLRDLDRLRSFTTTLQKRKMKLISSSLQQVEFQYSEKLSTTVNFGLENNVTVDFKPQNPHNRIRKLLIEIINERVPKFIEHRSGDHTPLDRFCTTLIFTRPILSTLDDLEDLHLLNPAVHSHSTGKYRLSYENPLCSFDIRIRPKHDKVYWQIEDNDRKSADVRPTPERMPSHKRLETLKVALNTLFKSNGKGWFGIRCGIIAELDGIPGALRKLHEVVMSCAMEGGYKPTAENDGKLAPTVGPGPSKEVRPPLSNQNRQQIMGKGFQGKQAMGGRTQPDIIEID
ncbi:MED14-domain-containing protein [Pleomassaria siparia CBS 279.74]|uniref:Mediator of RNA polymerase II transcription subunit 14 n=1 Tax=Pleomassaria siparia CBS 279.74 TaxID=1314801 RepID=A0A6G1JW13_9PLEO|nr:MED14-domain-containing protein [Pleomassaria siparia CBS 279.74]